MVLCLNKVNNVVMHCQGLNLPTQRFLRLLATVQS